MTPICPECGEPVTSGDRLHRWCCTHESVDPELGAGGDPAAEQPASGWCLDCGAHVHLSVPDEDGISVWEA